MTTALASYQPALPVPSRVGQATAIEQSRAIAEVQAAVVVAQQMPRDIERATREMIRSCGRKALAEKAFYRYKRAGSQVTGESVVLAKELARCWGNIQYGIAELSRNDAAGESEMQAFAWDLETNARPSTTFIVPHVRDTRDGRKRLDDVRDIYENNANMGARRQREMIFNVLPPWFIEDAKTACYETLNRDDSDGKTLAERAATAVGRFGKIGVKPGQLVQKLGAPQDKWSAADLAQLVVIYRSIERGETSKEDEFGASPERVTASEITGQRQEPAEPEKPAQRRRGRGAPPDASPAEPQRAPATAAAPFTPPAEPAGEAPMPPLPGEEEITAPVSGDTAVAARSAHADATGPGAAEPDAYVPSKRHGQLVGVVHQHFKRLSFTDDERGHRLAATAALAGINQIGSTNDLDEDELSTVADALARCKDRAALIALLAAAADVPGVGDE